MSSTNHPQPPEQAPTNTAIVLIDVYNEFLHPDGKINSIVKESLTETNTIHHLKELVGVAHRIRMPIFYALHQTWKEGNYQGWQRMNATTSGVAQSHAIEQGSWGAAIYEGLEPDVLGNKDVVVSKHWNSSGFANTDLDYQLRQRGITHLVIAGMIANTCVESTARYARELGYHVTLLSDGTAGFSNAHKDAAVNLVWPIIADEVKTVAEWNTFA
ncbi:Isochorismatase hydrolase [Plenodomus tracheiphilus IPT5]|uniref:Isochorismatase hydrolase n=1 Tax=Plenodomus tracheiphilus IPT5 TaxID=1408161 RepID=A0A6A7AR14_9PLEO|nr:Isochorismatase hydrolase [Plenodomus tracheiphilus IPT5]